MTLDFTTIDKDFDERFLEEERRGRPIRYLLRDNKGQLINSEYAKKEQIKDFYHQALEKCVTEAVEKERERIRSRVGWLRQWLNEKPADMLVTNEQIEGWLEIVAPSEEKGK